MEKKKPDDIMAEYLLRGGKMLSKACRACGSPLFEMKGETFCVVCREKGGEAGKEAAVPATPSAPAPAPVRRGAGTGTPAPRGESDEAGELRLAIAALARRAREETDPERCLALMEAARKAAEALSLLQR